MKALSVVLALALPFAANAQSDRAQAIGAIDTFATAFKEGRLADALAMSPPCVLDQMAAKQGLTRDGLIAKRRDETTIIRTLASSGDYVFDADLSGEKVTAFQGGLKVLRFQVKAQLGTLMPKQEFRMIAYTDGAAWGVASAANTTERKMLTNCYPGLRAKDLK